MLYNRPVSLGIDYFVNNLKGVRLKRTYWVEVSQKRKLKSKTDEIEEEEMKKGMLTNRYVSAFKIPKPKYPAQVGSPIVRIMKQLSEIEGIIFLELWIGVRNPEGVRGRAGQ